MVKIAQNKYEFEIFKIENRVFSSKNRVLNKVRDLLKNSLAMHSDLQEKGVENCLKAVTKDGFKLKNGKIYIFYKLKSLNFISFLTITVRTASRLPKSSKMVITAEMSKIAQK